MSEEKKLSHSGVRVLILVVGLLIMAFGVGFSIKSSLGTSPISSLPYVVSLFTPLTVGNATIILHCVLIALQVLLLRRRFHLMQLLQLPVAVMFGYMTDFAVWSLQDISANTYAMRWIFCIIGIIMVAIGVSCEVLSKVVTLAGEGFVLAACKVFPVKFGNMKVGFDVSLVILSCILSLIFLGGIQGVREGTVAAAICVGLLSKQINKPFGRLEEKYLN